MQNVVVVESSVSPPRLAADKCHKVVRHKEHQKRYQRQNSSRSRLAANQSQTNQLVVFCEEHDYSYNRCRDSNKMLERL